MKEGKSPMTRSDRIEQTLRQVFAPAALAVLDESAMHAGHAGAAAGGETHYQVTMVAAAFDHAPCIRRLPESSPAACTPWR